MYRADNPAETVAEIMLNLGRDTLLSSTEESPNSVWVVEDDAPKGVAGYYEKKRVPLSYRFVRDGRVVALDFHRDKTKYRIRCSHHTTLTENEQMVLKVLETLLLWIHEGIVTWDEAFSGFVRRKTTTEWWRILRLPPDATPKEVNAGYKRQAAKIHPDAGGTHEAFLELQAAYKDALQIVKGGS